MDLTKVIDEDFGGRIGREGGKDIGKIGRRKVNLLLAEGNVKQEKC